MNKNLQKFLIGVTIAYGIVELLSYILHLYDKALLINVAVSAILFCLAVIIIPVVSKTESYTFGAWLYIMSPIITLVLMTIFWRPLIYGIIPELVVFVLMTIIYVVLKKRK